jgi:hypothetical protein
MVEVFLRAAICLHGVVLNKLGAGIFLFFNCIIISLEIIMLDVPAKFYCCINFHMESFLNTAFQILCVRTNTIVLELCMWSPIHIGFPHNPQHIRSI